MKIFKEKKELPVLVVAILIFFSSLGFLAFAVYYIAFLPVPVSMQPLKVRILTNIQLEGNIEREEVKEGEDVEGVVLDEEEDDEGGGDVDLEL